MKPRSRIALGLAALSFLLPSLLIKPAATHADARATTPEDRYAMAGGCYTIGAAGGPVARAQGTFIVGGDPEPFFFKATDLGSYMLYGTARDFLAATDGPTGSDVVTAKRADESADWSIEQEAPGVFTIALPATGKRLVSDGARLSLAKPVPNDPAARFTFTLATGCTAFPEIEVNIDDSMLTPSTPIDAVQGYIDAHVHMMAYEFIGGRVRCGQPWNRYGVDQALVDCADHGPHGQTAALEMVLSGGDPVTGHSPDGWPSFQGWPKPGSLTHEQIYYKWLERAWRGGLRLMTNLLVDNHALCMAYPLKKNSCNEMDGVRLQAKRIRELERYIDAQSGGPGEGWFRIVTDPFQARAVINAGKLAVVLGIEVSTPFDCGIVRGLPICDRAKIDAGLDEVYALGVRQMELGNKFDNALTGITGDGGSTGIVVNQGNLSETGSYWKMARCPANAGDATDKLQENVLDHAHDGGAPDQLSGRDSIFAGVLEVSGVSGAAPVYPPGPHCNVMGLTDLGEYAVRGLAQRGMIFDPDHMSARARTEAMNVVESMNYSGVVSSHSWADDTIYPRVLRTGGVVTPHAGGSKGFLGAWQKLRPEADPRFTYGVGYGSDVNGFSKQGNPRNPTDNTVVSYPFTGLGGVIVNKQVSGTHTYDINTEGVAHYGLYTDWVQDLRMQGGNAIVDDLARGAEAYLQMWERATGIPGDACRSDIADLTPTQVSAVSGGMTVEQTLRALGQASTRGATAYTFCMQGGQHATVSFDADALVSSVSIS